MLTLRLLGGTIVTSTPSSSTRPDVGCSKPAISRNIVVLPQPEGPSREKNSPAWDGQVDVVDGELNEALGQRDQVNLPTGHGSLPS